MAADQPAPDPVDAAIAGTQRVEMVQAQVQLNSGRPAMIALPKDVTDLELLSFFGQVLAMGDQLRVQRPSSRLVVPKGVLPS